MQRDASTTGGVVKQLSTSYERLSNILNYDPETGIITWKRNIGRARAGKEAGTICEHGYRQLQVEGVRYYAHRLAWFFAYGQWPADQIDHINGDRADNRLCNLRESSQQDNCRNRRANHSNQSGIKGIYWDTLNNKWRAQICVAGTNQNLGLFDTKEAAAEAYEGASLLFFGAFALANRPAGGANDDWAQ
jgi:hypothetical protein